MHSHILTAVSAFVAGFAFGFVCGVYRQLKKYVFVRGNPKAFFNSLYGKIARGYRGVSDEEVVPGALITTDYRSAYPRYISGEGHITWKGQRIRVTDKDAVSIKQGELVVELAICEVCGTPKKFDGGAIYAEPPQRGWYCPLCEDSAWVTGRP